LNAAREIRAAVIKASEKQTQLRVTAKVTVPAVDGRPVVEIGNDQDLGLVISRAGLEPSLPLAHIVGGAKVRVPITATDLKPTEFVH
jgi:hypothetical protein